jgi:putative SOS response-associated peptidase YedK
MLKPAPPEGIRVYPIGTRVNSVKNDDAAILEPVST